MKPKWPLKLINNQDYEGKRGDKPISEKRKTCLHFHKNQTNFEVGQGRSFKKVWNLERISSFLLQTELTICSLSPGTCIPQSERLFGLEIDISWELSTILCAILHQTDWLDDLGNTISKWLKTYIIEKNHR